MSAPIQPDNAADLLAAIAEEQVGLQEDPRGSNAGPNLMKFFKADNLQVNGKTDGYPWCAAFICWCVQTWHRRLLFEGLGIEGFFAPTTPRAFALVSWAEGNRCQVSPPLLLRPKRGDLVVYKFSHCGIVTTVSATDRIFTAVEGNTNQTGEREGYEVARRPRTFSQVGSFIRLPVPQKCKEVPA